MWTVAPADARHLVQRPQPGSRGSVRRPPEDRSDGVGRAFDVLTAGAASVVLAPVMLVIAAAVALSSRGPILYRQTHFGRHGRPFRIVKFRTMHVGADTVAPNVTPAGDPRVTPVGRWLRASKLDELPQLWNVVKGDMTWVGPRPEVPEYVAHFGAHTDEVLSVRPGITDPASVAFADEAAVLADLRDAASTPESIYLARILPAKLAMNVDYLRRRTWSTDMAVVASTVGRVLIGRTASVRRTVRSVSGRATGRQGDATSR